MSFADRARRRDVPVVRGVGVGDEDHRLVERRALLVGRRRRLDLLKSHAPAISPSPTASTSVGVQRAGVERESADAELVAPAGAAMRAGASQRRGAIRRRAHADEQHALNAALAAGEMQRLVATAAEVAPRERAAERAAGRGVDGRELVVERRRASAARRRAAACRARRDPARAADESFSVMDRRSVVARAARRLRRVIPLMI